MVADSRAPASPVSNEEIDKRMRDMLPPLPLPLPLPLPPPTLEQI
jgi:hypothetical protein